MLEPSVRVTSGLLLLTDTPPLLVQWMLYEAGCLQLVTGQENAGFWSQAWVENSDVLRGFLWVPFGEASDVFLKVLRGWILG